MPPASETPLFDSLLLAQLGGRPELAEALCALLGRALAGDSPALPVWIAGPGQTGKTVLARAFEALFPPEAVGRPDYALPPNAALLLAHERADPAEFRALDGGPLPGLAVSNHPPRTEGAGRLALFSFGNRVANPSHGLLPDILATELPALRARLLLAARALRDGAAANGGDVWAALPSGVAA